MLRIFRTAKGIIKIREILLYTQDELKANSRNYKAARDPLPRPPMRKNSHRGDIFTTGDVGPCKAIA